MSSQFAELRDSMNGCKFDPTSRKGHYESYFLRANHPDRPQAFWIRYTIFSPRGNPEQSIGELWAAFFDGQENRVTAAKTEVPIGECAFSPDGLAARIGGATLGGGQLAGRARSAGNEIAWDLSYAGDNRPLLLLAAPLYEASFPKAKAVVGNPGVNFTGDITVNGETLPIDEWVGSENHNWGPKHTDEYAWGQVAGFDNDPDAFLECVTGRVRQWSIWSPRLTFICCRANGREFALNGLRQALKAKGGYGYFDWRFRSEQDGVTVEGRMRAPKESFVGLNYYNPPGGSHTCLNSKIAACELVISETGRESIRLQTGNRAAFEILTDDQRHGVPVVA